MNSYRFFVNRLVFSNIVAFSSNEIITSKISNIEISGYVFEY